MIRQWMRKNGLRLTLLLGGLAATSLAFAASDMSAGDVASQIVGSMDGLSKLIISGSLIAGMGFAVGAVLKFKQHKDNPTQIPVGTPVALTFIAAALIFMPSIFASLGQTVFGDNKSIGNLSGTASIIKQ